MSDNSFEIIIGNRIKSIQNDGLACWWETFGWFFFFLQERGGDAVENFFVEKRLSEFENTPPSAALSLSQPSSFPFFFFFFLSFLSTRKVENISNSGGSHGLLGMRNSGLGQEEKKEKTDRFFLIRLYFFFLISLPYLFLSYFFHRSFRRESGEVGRRTIRPSFLPFFIPLLTIFRILIVKPARFLHCLIKSYTAASVHRISMIWLHPVLPSNYNFHRLSYLSLFLSLSLSFPGRFLIWLYHCGYYLYLDNDDNDLTLIRFVCW